MSQDTTNAEVMSSIGEIEHGPSKLDLFLEKNFKYILVAVIVVAVAVTVFMVTGVMNQSAREEAGAALMNAETSAEYVQVAKDFEGSASAGTALILAANQNIQDGKTAEAKENLQSFLSGYQDHAGVEKAKLSLASIYANGDEAAEAEELYLDLINGSDAIAPAAYLGLAELALAKQDQDKAKQWLTEAQESFGDSTFSGELEARIAMNDYQLPTVVEPATTSASSEEAK